MDMVNDLLCEELLEEIFGRLEKDISWYRNVCLVCKRWLSVQRRVKKNLGLLLPVHLPSSCQENLVRVFLSQFPNVSRLSLVTDQEILLTDASFPDDLLHVIAQSCKFLRELRFAVGGGSSHGLRALSAGCSNLTKAEFFSLKSEFIPILSELKSLKELSLVLSGCESEDMFFSRKGDLSMQIERLKLVGLGTGYKGMEWLWKNCPKLTKLEFRSCEGLGISDISAFVKCLAGLEELRLRRCRTIANAILLRAAEYSKCLKSLVFYDGGDAEGLHAIVRGCKRLELLDLRLPLDLGNEDLVVIAENGGCLRTLSLHSCWLASGEGIKSLAPGLRYLEELILVRCRAAVQEPGTLTSLCQQLQHIKKLDLSDNDHLLDRELNAMLPSCGNLSGLRLWRCRKLTDVSMYSIIQRCPILEVLDIGRCDGISANAVFSLVLQCPRLTRVVVEGFKVTEEIRRVAAKRRIVIVNSEFEASVYKRDIGGLKCFYNDLVHPDPTASLL